MRIYFVSFLIFWLSVGSARVFSKELEIKSVCVDNPSELIKNGGKCKVLAEKISVIDAAIYSAINSCLLKSKKIEFNEFITDWNRGSPYAKLMIYGNRDTYFLSFSLDGDVGGGFGCLYGKIEKKIQWIDPYY